MRPRSCSCIWLIEQHCLLFIFAVRRHNLKGTSSNPKLAPIMTIVTIQQLNIIRYGKIKTCSCAAVHYSNYSSTYTQS